MADLVAQKWAVYESNIQQYRVLSATVQSFLLVVGAVLYASPSVSSKVLIAVLILGLLHIFYVRVPVVYHRLKIADYYLGQLPLSESRQTELAEFCSEHRYVTNTAARLAVREDYFGGRDGEIPETIRATRFKVDVLVPGAYVIIWLSMAMSMLGRSF